MGFTCSMIGNEKKKSYKIVFQNVRLGEIVVLNLSLEKQTLVLCIE
jgi:hypothetical protein